MVEVNDRKTRSTSHKNLRGFQAYSNPVTKDMMGPEMLFYDIIFIFILDIKVKHEGLLSCYKKITYFEE